MLVCVKSHTQTNTQLSQMVQICEPESEQHVSYSIEIYANWHPIPEQCTNSAKIKRKSRAGAQAWKRRPHGSSQTRQGSISATSVAMVKEVKLWDWDTIETHRKLDFSHFGSFGLNCPIWPQIGQLAQIGSLTKTTFFFCPFAGPGRSNCDFHGSGRNPCARNEVRSPKTVVNLWFSRVRRDPFARNEVRSPKTVVKLRFARFRRNTFARNDVRSPKTLVKLRFARFRRNPFARNDVRSQKTEVKLWFSWVRSQPLRTKWGSIAKNCGKIVIFTGPAEPRNEGWSLKTEVKWYFCV